MANSKLTALGIHPTCYDQSIVSFQISSKQTAFSRCQHHWGVTTSPLLEFTMCTANPRTNIVDFRGFDSSIILIKRGGILRPIGDFLESSSQAMLVGVMLTGRLGVVLLCSLLLHPCTCLTITGLKQHDRARNKQHTDNKPK